MPFQPGKPSPCPPQDRNQSQYSHSNLLNTSTEKKRHGRTAWLVVSLLIMLGSVSMWFRIGTIQGVPVSIVGKFLRDKPARDAYFDRDLNALHDRLSELGVEEDIKAFYRPRFDSEAKLDWYIHQLLYDRTGYVGKSYKLGAEQQLVLKTTADKRFPRWFDLAEKIGLADDFYEVDGITYVVLSDGSTVLYEAFAELYPVKTLRQIHRRRKQLN